MYGVYDMYVCVCGLYVCGMYVVYDVYCVCVCIVCVYVVYDVYSLGGACMGYVMCVVCVCVLVCVNGHVEARSQCGHLHLVFRDSVML